MSLFRTRAKWDRSAGGGPMAQQAVEVAGTALTDEQLASIVRESPFPLFLAGLQDSRIVEVSRAFEEWTMRTHEELVGSRLLDYAVDQETADRSLALLESGVLDAYTRRPVVRRSDGQLL